MKFLPQGSQSENAKFASPQYLPPLKLVMSTKETSVSRIGEPNHIVLVHKPK